MKPKYKFVYGLAINDADYPVYKYVNGRRIWVCPLYEDWKHMLRRSICDVFKHKSVSYIDTSVCEEWLTFSNFRKWVLEEQPNKYWENCSLDKDLLFRDNKHYCPETCVYVPQQVNTFILDRKRGRGAQRVWVNAPSDSAVYGKEVRQCIIPEDGKVLVGVDMKSAQLSIAAYYANNYDYYNNVASGIEFDDSGKYIGKTAHCVNARMFGMVTEKEWLRAVDTQDKDLIHHISLRRKASKGGSFAVIFGASGKKVAKTIGIPEKEGNRRKNQFLEQMGLDNVISTLATFEKKYQYKSGFYLPLAFGYWLWNNSSHKSVNTIVQGFEALAQKMAVIRMGRELDRLNLRDNIRKVIDCHDEVLLEVDIGYEDQAGKLAGESYTWAAEQIFKFHRNNHNQFANSKPPVFPIDLNGGYKVGDNYYNVH